MSKIAATMPEARYRTTKKVQPIRSTPASQRLQTATTAVANPAAALVAEKPKAAQAKPAQRKTGAAIASWWPVAVGIFLSGFAPEWHAMAAQAGIWALRAVFPLTLLAAHREIGIDSQMAALLPQLALFLQFPLEGLLTKLTLDRGKGLKAAIAQLILIHGVTAFVLWLTTFSVK